MSFLNLGMPAWYALSPHLNKETMQTWTLFLQLQYSQSSPLGINVLLFVEKYDFL